MATPPHGAQLICSHHSRPLHTKSSFCFLATFPQSHTSCLSPQGQVTSALRLQTTDVPLNLGQATPPLQPHFSIAEYLLQTQLFPTARSFPSLQSWALRGRWSQHGPHPITHLLYVRGVPPPCLLQGACRTAPILDPNSPNPTRSLEAQTGGDLPSTPEDHGLDLGNELETWARHLWTGRQGSRAGDEERARSWKGVGATHVLWNGDKSCPAILVPKFTGAQVWTAPHARTHSRECLLLPWGPGLQNEVFPTHTHI